MPESDVEKGLKQFEKELDEFLSIAQKIEACKPKETPNNELALEVKLAQLQTDSQNYLAISLALFAAMAALIAIFYEKPLTYQGIIFFIMILVFGYFAGKAALTAQLSRNKMNRLLDKTPEEKSGIASNKELGPRILVYTTLLISFFAIALVSFLLAINTNITLWYVSVFFTAVSAVSVFGLVCFAFKLRRVFNQFDGAERPTSG
jgi:hypothetical protein